MPHTEPGESDSHAVGAARDIAEREAATALAQPLDQVRPIRVGPRSLAEQGGQGWLGPLAGGLVSGPPRVGGTSGSHGGLASSCRGSASTEPVAGDPSVQSYSVS